MVGPGEELTELETPEELAHQDASEFEADVAEGEGIELELGANAEMSEEGSDLQPPDRRLITAPFDLAVVDLVSAVKAERLILGPVYQRKYVWDNAKASKLVESLLINVPIPVCYLAEEGDGRRSVIDGQQRLRSLDRFLNNEFALRGLEVLPELNRKRFHHLTDRQQRLIGNRTIRCIVISEDSDPDIRFDVFERLNTGSVPLNAQELRNSVYRGSFNQLLRELADAEIWRSCIGAKSNQRMVFEELTLRFFALHDRLPDYRPSLKRFLNDFMRIRRDISDDERASMTNRFLDTMQKVEAVFGEHSFRRVVPDSDPVEWRPALNSALFDTVMINFAHIDQPVAEFIASAARIESELVSLMTSDDEFSDAISLATGDRSRLRRRIRLFAERLETIGFDSGLAPAMCDE